MRRLTRYSIRSLLVLVTLACIALGWYGANRNVRQREVAAIEELGKLMRYAGIVTIEEGDNLRCGFGVTGVATVRPMRPYWLTRRLNPGNAGVFQRVVEFSSWERMDDRAVPHLAQLKSLEQIDLSDSHLSEHGIAQLRELFPRAKIELQTRP